MKLKVKRIFSIVIICILGSTIPVFAQMKTEKVKPRGAIFMGKVLEVEPKDKDNNTRIRVKGYIKGCEVYEEEILAIITKDTKVMINNCNEEKNNEENKNKSEEINIEVGDNLFICLSDVMTKSIPPQVVAKRIQITKQKS